MLKRLFPPILAVALLVGCQATPAPTATPAPPTPTAAAELPTLTTPPAPTAPPSVAPTVTPAPVALAPPTATPGFPETRITAANVANLRLLRTIGFGGARAAAIAPDNSLIAVGTSAGLALFGLPAFNHLRFDPIPGGVEAVAFAADGASLRVLTSGGGELRRLNDGVILGPDPQPLAAGLPAAEDLRPTLLSPDGQLRARLSVPDSVPLPGVQLTRFADEQIIHEDETTLGVFFSPDSSLIGLIAVDGTLALLDRAGAAQGKLALPAFWGVGFTPDSQSIVTSAQRLWLWDAVSGKLRSASPELDLVSELATLGGEQRISASADGAHLIVEGAYFMFEATQLMGHAFRLGEGEPAPAWVSSAYGPGIMSFETYVGAVSPATERAAYTTDGVALELYRGAQLERTLQVPAGVGDLAFSPDAALLAVGDKAGLVRLLPLDNPAAERSLQAPGPVVTLEFSADAALLGARTAEGAIAVWRVADGQQIALLADNPPAPSPWVIQWRESFTFTSDGQLLVAWGPSGVRFFQLSDGQLLHRIEGAVEGLAIGPQRRLLALLRAGRVELWGLPE